MVRSSAAARPGVVVRRGDAALPRSPWRRLLRVLAGVIAVAALALGITPAASAHPVGASGVYVTVRSGSVGLELQVPVTAFARATGIAVDAATAPRVTHEEAVRAAIRSGVRVTDGGPTPLRLDVGRPVIERVNGQDALVTKASATPTDGRRITGDVALSYTLVTTRSATHHAYVFLVSDVLGGRVSERGPQLLGILDGTRTHIAIERPRDSWWTAFVAMVGLGVQHIEEGTDHVLFLLTLLLVAPLTVVGRRWAGMRWAGRRTARAAGLHTLGIVSSFTAGHATSLALVSFGLVRFPDRPVEFLVSFSILVAAVHAFHPLTRRGELWVGALFGLVHGTAFATTIVDLGLDVPATIVAVLGFNVGVELAQLVVVALVLPVLLLLVRTPCVHWVRRTVAVFSAVASVAWMVAIVTGGETVLAPFFDLVGAFPLICYGAFVSLAVGIWAVTRPVAQEPATTVRRASEVDA